MGRTKFDPDIYPCGHPRTDENTYTNKKGHSRCRICQNESNRKYSRQRGVRPRTEYLADFAKKSDYGCGHPKTKENTYKRGDGTVACKECSSNHAKEYRRRRKINRDRAARIIGE